LNNVQYVVPVQKIINGKKWSYVEITLGRMVPYRIREDISGYIIDFDVSTLPSKVATMDEESTSMEKSASTMKIFELIKKEELQKEKDSKQTGDIIKYTGSKISLLSFQKADIKSVLRAISAYSGFNIVSGPDVKGKVTIHMKDVPWDQALDTVLEINGLGKKQSGTVITVLPLKKLKDAEKEQQQKDVAEGKLRQISIEAKIVEASTNFARELGINWGAGHQGTWNDRDFGILFGNAAAGTPTSLPGGIGLTSSNVAVNFPAVTGVATPALGILMGTGKWILDAQLSALETTGKGKIISSPKVTTLDNVWAQINQGEQIPYTNPGDGNSVEFKDAVLQLDVKPNITPSGKISMEVKVKNDYADWNKTDTSNRNPPIIKSRVESKIVIEDGETLVLGGIYKTNQVETVSGTPWLSKIPVLGWLFKYKNITTEKRELLIFITPRIVSKQGT
jgi:type IV pilus assembly protein PilQ